MIHPLLKNLPLGWQQAVGECLKESELEKLSSFHKFLSEEDKNKNIFPPKKMRFKAFELCPLDKAKVVILGQDPYHGKGQAMGLSFSVPKDQKLPPSLKNIYKELSEDLKVSPPENGDLTNWAHQGVLLLNTVLTVEESKAGSHQKKGWEIFTKAVLKALNDRDNIVFILWGSPAQKTASFINEKRHLVLKSVHPSPLSSYRGFFGSRPFSKTNKYLKSHGNQAIKWV